MTGAVWIGIGTLALVVGAVLSALAQSLRDLSRTTLEEIAAIRNRPSASERVAAILDDIEGHAAAIALPRIVCNLTVVVSMVMWITALRGKVAAEWVDGLAGAGCSAILLWLFSFILPTAVAKHAGEATVYAWSPMVRALYLVSGPFTAMARGVDEVVRRLSGQREKDQAETIEEELLSVVEDAREEGKFDETERDMIEAVVRFRNRTVAQVMTPRTEIEAMELCNDLGMVTQTIRKIGHSRIPVYEGSIDHVVGVFYVKDLMKWLAGEGSRGGKTFDLKSLLRPALFVPETKTVRELLPELLGKRVHIALVADEYGGTAGLVTIEDIIEEVFGDIQDEYEQQEEEAGGVAVNAAAKTAEVDARAYITDVNAELRGLGMDLPESEDYDTVGGFVTVTLGRIPTANETFQSDNVLVTVLAAEATRVTRVRLAKATDEETVVEVPGAERESEERTAGKA